MIDIYVRRGEKIPLGREGTRGVRRVIYDFTRWVREYGGGVVQLIVQRPGESQPYPIALIYEGDTAIWEINSADTATPGEGKCEWQYYVGDKLEKSEIYTTVIVDSLADPTDEAPDRYDIWMEALLEVASVAEMHKRGAETARQGAETAAAAAAGSREDAAAQAAAALKYAQGAAQSETNAKTAQQAAEKAKADAETAAKAAAQSEKNAAASEKNAAGSATAAGNSAREAKTSEENAAKSEQEAEDAAEAAKDLVANADWMDVEIDENGDLIFSHADSFTGAEFELTENGDLEVTYT